MNSKPMPPAQGQPGPGSAFLDMIKNKEAAEGGGFFTGSSGLAGAMPMMPPMAPPLSNNVNQAKQMGIMGMSQGVPREALYQQLAQQYDKATLEFVFAALPNRLPQ